MEKKASTTEHKIIKPLIALSMMRQMGSQRIRLLKQHAGSIEGIFEMDYSDLTAIHGIGKQIANELLDFDKWDEVERILDKTEQMGASIFTPKDEQYPSLLKQIYDPPLTLWIKGDVKVLESPSISVVGTRSCSSYGKHMARRLVQKLVDEQITITSGLAYGIDTVAHQTTVDNGGKTIAVLGSGIDVIYPRSNLPLSQKIVETGGAVISEFPPGTAPDAQNFPVRNRIVSGLSMGTLVIESGLKGGSMITINSAINQNREAFAIPHALTANNNRGCNTLIRDGVAKLVMDAGDILNEITHFKRTFSENEVNEPPKPAWQTKELTEQQEHICKTISEDDGTMHIDNLAETLDTSTSVLLADLLQLEMQGCIEQKAGKHFQVK